MANEVVGRDPNYSRGSFVIRKANLLCDFPRACSFFYERDAVLRFSSCVAGNFDYL